LPNVQSSGIGHILTSWQGIALVSGEELFHTFHTCDHGNWSDLGCFDFLVDSANDFLFHVHNFLILNVIFDFRNFDPNGFVDSISDSGICYSCSQHGM